MKIIFCGGGTAGHITPALAIAEYLKINNSPEILFIGREGGEENRAIKESGFELETIKVKGFDRKINLDNFKKVIMMAHAIKKAKKIIKDFSPDVVIGTGGYVSWPVLRVAQSLKIPTVIHESNACPGLVTKLLSKKCNKVLLNFEGSEKEFKRKDNIKIVGNPVREKFLTENKFEVRKRLGIGKGDFLISSFGGSGGSEKINEVIIEFMQEHSSKNKKIRHIHSCGNKYFPEIDTQYPELTRGKSGCVILPYIDNMSEVILASDIVISRCGAMTISEICAAGVASILIPSPNVTNNHQYKNAKLICELDAAIMIEESELTLRKLIDTVKEFETNSQKRKSLSDKIKKFYLRDSKKIIADEILKLI